MRKDQQDLLDVLKAELEFVEKGGYRHPERAAWRPRFVFQDSPSCLNFDSTRPARRCGECALIQAVPVECSERRFPCRHIPLNEQGDTLDSLYRSGTQEEIESALAEWLKSQIARLGRIVAGD